MLSLLQLEPHIFKLTQGKRRYLAGIVVVGLLITATYFFQALLLAGILQAIFAGEFWQDLLPQIGGIISLVVLRSGLIWLKELVATPSVTDPEQPVRTIDLKHNPLIAIEKISFAYDQGNRIALRDLSFQVAAGEK